MAYQDNFIVRVDCKCENGVRVCYCNSSVENYEIPEGTKEIIYYKDGSSTSYSADLINKDADSETISPEEKRQIEELHGNGATKISYTSTAAPTMQYCDITETEMFGFKEISKNVLVSPDNGLWAYHGLRKLRFEIKDMQTDADEYEIRTNLVFDHRENDEMAAVTSEYNDVIRNISYESASEKDYEFFIYVDTNKLGDKFEGDFANKQKMLFTGYLQVQFLEVDSTNSITYIFPVELLVNNTNYGECKKIQKNMVSIDFGTSSSCVAVRGDDGVELLTLSASEDSDKNINIYENPTCIMLYRWEEIYQQWKNENDDYPLVTKGNLDEHKLNLKSVQYDFGYSVKNHMKEVDDQQLNSILTEIKMIPKLLSEGQQESVRPLVTQSKRVINLVDSYEKQDDENFDVIAFYGYILGKAINRVEKNKIYTRFNVTYPVKFSSVVRDKVKKSLEYGLQRSLPKPLRTALNNKNKPLFRVEMKYPEPVAYIGSVCGKYLKYDTQNYKPQLFGVFDFGGGTLDYSFGVFAKDEDDETSSNIYVLGVDGDSNVGGELLIKKMAYWLYTSKENLSTFVRKQIPFEKPVGEVLPDECPEELFNSTADAKSNVRKICERFTRDIFQGVSSNKNEISENKEEDAASSGLSFVLPVNKGKNTRDVDPEKNNEETASVESQEGSKAQATNNGKASELNITNSAATILLHDINGNEVEVSVTVDSKSISDLLEEVLEQKVVDFKNSMERTFKAHNDLLKNFKVKFDLKDVLIFEAGNSSKNVLLQEKMKSIFDDSKIMLVDETNDEFMNSIEDKGTSEDDGTSKDTKAKKVVDTKPKKVALTPKTAVAFGQVVLSDYYVDDSYIHQGTGDAPFNWYVGNINRGDNSFVMLIDKANTSTDWVKYGKINSEDMKIYYSETPVGNNNFENLRAADVDFLDEDDLFKILFVKVAGSDSLVCCVCEKGETPSPETVGQEVLLK